MSELTPWRTFSIFISSTFADMQAERDHLKTYAFPKVEEELRKQRIRLETVDLRWGVDTAFINKEDDREATVLKVCLDEIKRCRPFFIGLLGDRYGWVPPEERMKNALLGEDMETELEGKSVTALEIEFGVLANKEQLNRSVFYFREPFDYTKFSSEKKAVYTDEYNPELTVEDEKSRASSLAKLKVDIKNYFEIQGLKGEELEKKVKTYSVSWDSEQQKAVGLEEWGNIVYDDIIRECDAHNKDTKHEAPKNWQEEELALLDAFIEGHTHITKTRNPDGKAEEISTFCGRVKLLDELKQHLLLKDKENWGLVLTGESGSGKSAVYSMVYKMMQKEDCFVLAHSAGLSPKSKNLLDLLQIWNKQLSEELGIEYKEPESKREDKFETHEDLIPEMESSQQKKPKLEIEKIQDKFRELLLTVAEQKQVVLLIDALDRFEPTERAKYLTWLPTVLPGNIRMLCTAITDTEQNAVKYHSNLFVKSIDFFTPVEAKEMLTMLCKRQHKNLPEKVETIILKKKREDGLYATSSPLWLSLAVNILMAMDNDDFEKMKQLAGRGDEVIEDYMQALALDYPPLPGKLFLSLINKATSIFGEDFTHKVFNYIACSRDGLREIDLEKLIPKTEKENWNALMFANLRRWFNAHLREEGENLQWNLVHSILRNSLLKEMDKDAFKNINNNIANYLVCLPQDDTLKTTETMYHLMQAKNVQQALDYYIYDLTEEEEIGATKVLAEAISESKDGLEWVVAIIEATICDNKKVWDLAPCFIYNFNNALEEEGWLEVRLQTLDLLKSRMEPTADKFIHDEDYRNDYATLHDKLGEIHEDMGHMEEALKYFEKSNQLSKELYDSNLEKVANNRGLAISYSKLGKIHMDLSHMEEAMEYFKKYNQLSKDFYDLDPQNEFHKDGLVHSYQFLGIIHKKLEQKEEALKYFEMFNQLSKELYESNPNDITNKKHLALSYQGLGDINKTLELKEEALKYIEKYNQLSKELYESNPKNVTQKAGLAISYSKLGIIHMDLGQMEEAIEYFEKYNQLSKELYESDMQNELHKMNLATSEHLLGCFHQAMENMEESLMHFEKYYQLYKELYESNPINVMNMFHYSNSLFCIGNIYYQMHKSKKALVKYLESIDIANKLKLTYPYFGININNMARIYYNLFRTYLRLLNITKFFLYSRLLKKTINYLASNNIEIDDDIEYLIK